MSTQIKNLKFLVALLEANSMTKVELARIMGGNLTDAYGGGLGRLATDAVGVEGDDDYVPAKTAVAALVEGNATVTLNGSVVNGSVFGANNVNGTPQGHVKVHVLQTQKRAIPDTDPVQYEDFDVAAVYGGGNQADGKAGTFDIGCTGGDSEGIGDLFGGAREANITGDVA